MSKESRWLAVAEIKMVICGITESIKVLENYKDQLAAQVAELES